MDRKEILDKVNKILRCKLKIDYSKIAENNYDLELTDYRLKLKAVDIFYLFMEIEREFKLKIDCKQILNYEFNTLNGIVNILEKQLA